MKKISQKRSIIIAVVMIVVLAIMFLIVGHISTVPKAKNAVDLFGSYVYKEQHTDGSLMTVTVSRDKSNHYYAVQSYADGKGKYMYDTSMLTDKQSKLFEKSLKNFSVDENAIDIMGAYKRGTLTFRANGKTSTYDVDLIDVSDMLLHDPWSDNDMTMYAGINQDVNTLFTDSILQIKSLANLNSQAQIGAYLSNVLQQISDVETLKSDKNIFDGKYDEFNVNTKSAKKNGYFTISVKTVNGSATYQVAFDGHLIVDGDTHAALNKIQTSRVSANSKLDENKENENKENKKK